MRTSWRKCAVVPFGGAAPQTWGSGVFHSGFAGSGLHVLALDTTSPDHLSTEFQMRHMAHCGCKYSAARGPALAKGATSASANPRTHNANPVQSLGPRAARNVRDSQHVNYRTTLRHAGLPNSLKLSFVRPPSDGDDCRPASESRPLGVGRQTGAPLPHARHRHLVHACSISVSRANRLHADDGRDRRVGERDCAKADLGERVHRESVSVREVVCWGQDPCVQKNRPSPLSQGECGEQLFTRVHPNPNLAKSLSFCGHQRRSLNSPIAAACLNARRNTGFPENASRQRASSRKSCASLISEFMRGWSSPVARQSHKLKVAGSNPVPATNPQPVQNGSAARWCWLHLECSGTDTARSRSDAGQTRSGCLGRWALTPERHLLASGVTAGETAPQFKFGPRPLQDSGSGSSALQIVAESEQRGNSGKPVRAQRGLVKAGRHNDRQGVVRNFPVPMRDNPGGRDENVTAFPILGKDTPTYGRRDDDHGRTMPAKAAPSRGGEGSPDLIQSSGGRFGTLADTSPWIDRSSAPIRVAHAARNLSRANACPDIGSTDTTGLGRYRQAASRLAAGRTAVAAPLGPLGAPHQSQFGSLPIARIEPAAYPLCPVAKYLDVQKGTLIGGAKNGVGDGAVSCELKAPFATRNLSRVGRKRADDSNGEYGEPRPTSGPRETYCPASSAGKSGCLVSSGSAVRFRRRAPRYPSAEERSCGRSIAVRGLTGTESVSAVLSAVLLTNVDPDAVKGAGEALRLCAPATIRGFGLNECLTATRTRMAEWSLVFDGRSSGGGCRQCLAAPTNSRPRIRATSRGARNTRTLIIGSGGRLAISGRVG